MLLISRTVPTTSLVLITCAIIWPLAWPTGCSVTLAFAIIDEVDSILIDEARTPLIISGQAEDSSELYRQINTVVPMLERQEKKTKKARWVTVTSPSMKKPSRFM